MPNGPHNELKSNVNSDTRAASHLLPLSVRPFTSNTEHPPQRCSGGFAVLSPSPSFRESFHNSETRVAVTAVAICVRLVCAALTSMPVSHKTISNLPQGAAKLTKDDIERVFSLYDRVSAPLFMHRCGASWLHSISPGLLIMLFQEILLPHVISAYYGVTRLISYHL